MSRENHTAPIGSRPIPSLPGYAICDGGSIFSCRSNGTITDKWRPVKPRNPDRNGGHIKVELATTNGPVLRFVHALVLETFKGPCPPDFEARHLDGNRLNNSSGNLTWYRPVPPENSRPIPGIPNYAIMDGGELWTCVKRGPRGRTGAWRIVKPRALVPSGHLMVCVSIGGESVPRYIHRLVLEAFVGPCPEGLECCHNDDNPKNNRVVNLRWDTRANNRLDMIKNGRSTAGVKNRQAKLTDADIVAMFVLKKEGRTVGAIAKSFNVASSAVSNILSRRGWKHVQIPDHLLSKLPTS